MASAGGLTRFRTPAPRISPWLPQWGGKLKKALTPWHTAVRMRPSLAHYPGQRPGARIICPRQDAG
ncbi:hypothetical protein RSPO_m00358 (plasmid) [Ralstonia solanacearum Po82]|uniref:Uncharacterized protein n=1 Tax=Ralstonia solanacearum (strain Po82) TaxID=1031711 RepID=F6G7J6_RALS8|nr:hypothetical protein RSPO_m00358 [Ralstonia solanacearum Po82]